MSDYVVRESLGVKILGQEQYDYNVNGTAGCDYGVAVAKASFLRAYGIESCITAYVEALKKRQKKLSELADALGVINACTRKFSKDNSMSDTTTHDGLGNAKEICERYGITEVAGYIKFVSTSSAGVNTYKISRENCQSASPRLQTPIDVENTDLQEDLTLLQSLVNKRDSAYSMGSKLMKKANQTAKTTINNIH